MKTLKVIGLLVLVFAAGFSGGVVATRILVRQMVANAVAHPQQARSRVEQNIEQNLDGKLHLDPDQRARVRQILKESQAKLRVVREEFQPKFNAVILDTRTNIAALLRPEQEKLFEQFLADNRQFLPLHELPPVKKDLERGLPRQ